MSSNRGSRLWVIGGVMLALLLIAGTYMFVVSPARTQVATVQSQVDDATLQQTVLRNRLRDLEATAKAMEGLKGQVAAAKAALPATVDTQGLLRRVQAVVTGAGAIVGNVTISPAVASVVDGVSAVPVTLVLDGTADQLVSVVDQLQSDRSRLMTVSNQALKSGGGPNAFQLDLTVQVYAAAAPAAAVAGGTTAATGSAAGAGADGAAAQSSNPTVAS